MLTERSEVVQVEITGPKIIHEITANIVERDGVEIARTKSRKAFPPGADLTGASESVLALAALWTADDIAAYQASGQ